MSYLPLTDAQHVPLFSGSIWYVKYEQISEGSFVEVA